MCASEQNVTLRNYGFNFRFLLAYVSDKLQNEKIALAQIRGVWVRISLCVNSPFSSKIALENVIQWGKRISRLLLLHT